MSHGPLTLYFVLLVMVGTMCPCGHYDRGGYDSAGTRSSYWIIYDVNRDPLAQLRRASGNFSNFVLIRVVRLTIETNALTGTSLSNAPRGHTSHFYLSRLGHHRPRALCRLTRKYRPTSMHILSSEPITGASFSE